MNKTRYIFKFQSKILQKPDDQLELSEQVLIFNFQYEYKLKVV